MIHNRQIVFTINSKKKEKNRAKSTVVYFVYILFCHIKISDILFDCRIEITHKKVDLQQL